MLFKVGRVVITRNALDSVMQNNTEVLDLVHRHSTGDWGCVGPEDAAENELSIKLGLRIMSVYMINDVDKLWIITEADRSSTTVLLPKDY